MNTYHLLCKIFDQEANVSKFKGPTDITTWTGILLVCHVHPSLHTGAYRKSNPNDLITVMKSVWVQL